MLRHLPASRMVRLAVAAALTCLGACSRGVTLGDADFVTVGDLENRAADAIFDESLRQVVVNQLQQSPYFVVVPDQRIQRTLRALRHPPTEPVVGDRAREVCGKLGARATIGGSIAKNGDAYTVALTATDCTSGASLASVQQNAATRAAVIDATGQAADALRKALGEPAESLAKYDVPAAKALTGSIDALRPYAMGLKVRAVSGDDGAVPFFERATQLDPEFALAWSKLGVVQSNTGQVESARQSAKRAFDLPERATTFDRAYITWNHAARVSHDGAAVRGALEQLIRAYPRDFAARNNSGVYHTGRGEFEAALADYREAITRGPDEPVPVINVGYSLLFLNRRDEAYDALGKYLETHADPGVAVTRWLSAAMARDPRATTFLQAVQKMTPPAQVLGAQSALAVWRGRLKEYGDLQASLRNVLSQYKNEAGVAAVAASERMTRAVYQRGPAIAALQAELRQSKNAATVAQGAALLASIGETAAAEPLLKAVEAEAPNGQAVFMPVAVARAYLRAAHGEAAAAAADIDGLLTEFPQTLELSFHLGRLRELAGDLPGAATAYRTVIAAMPVLGLNAAIAPARLYLAQVLEKQGDAAGARVQYAALAEQWKDADGAFYLKSQIK